MEFYRVTDVAAKLGVSRSQVHWLATRGKLPHVKRGNRLVFPKAAWEAWERAQVRAALASVGMEVPQDAA